MIDFFPPCLFTSEEQKIAGWMGECLQPHALCMLSKVLGRMGMTTGINLWSGSGSCWVLPTLHRFWPWLVTGFEFCRRKPELRCCFSHVFLMVFHICPLYSRHLWFFSILQMEGLRAHATDWTQNIQNMSVDFRISGKIDDPFKRRRRRRHHRSHSHAPNGDIEGKGEHGQTESESYSSYSYTSSESGSGSETDSQATQTDRVPEAPDPRLTQPLDYFGENLAFIDESSDAQSGKLHVDPLQNVTQPNARPHQTRRRRRRRNHKVSRYNHDQKELNGTPALVPDLPLP